MAIPFLFEFRNSHRFRTGARQRSGAIAKGGCSNVNGGFGVGIRKWSQPTSPQFSRLIAKSKTCAVLSVRLKVESNGWSPESSGEPMRGSPITAVIVYGIGFGTAVGLNALNLI